MLRLLLSSIVSITNIHTHLIATSSYPATCSRYNSDQVAFDKRMVMDLGKEREITG